MVNELKTLDEYKAAITNSPMLVVDFTATWCPPCQRIKPIFEGFATEYPDVTFVKVDVDENSEAAQEAGVQCMPTFKFFKNGAESDKLEGASKDQLVEKIQALIAA